MDASNPSLAQNAPSISLILPAYNEQETIEQAILEADQALSALTKDYEIFVVDDGSHDRTAALVESIARRNAAIRLLRQPQNEGYGAALRRGFESSEKNLVAFTDADCQFDLTELDRLVLLARDYEIVCGYRIRRQDPWLRRFYSRAYNFLAGALAGTGVRDCDCAMKVFHRESIQAIPLESNGFFINTELLAHAQMQGRSIVEVGVSHRPRPRGESTVSIRHALPVGLALLRFWWTKVAFPRAEGAKTSTLLDENGAWSPWTERFAGLLLAIGALLLLVANLSYPLMEPDETRYAQIGLEMYETGDWVTPTLEGEPYFDKPPLLYWMTALSYQAFGVHETAARLPCALAAFFTVMGAFFLGRRLVGARAAWLGAVALLLCGGFVLSARFLVMDGPLTLFTTVTLLSLFLATRGPQLHWGWWALAAFCCGLGVLTKGPVAAVICFPPWFAARWLGGDSAPLRIRHWLAFGALASVAALPWFIAITAVHESFAGHFLWKHHLIRFFSAFNHQQPWWYYAPLLLAGMFPASMLFPSLAVFLFSRSPRDRGQRTPELGFLLLAAAWTLVFFSLSTCKLPTYILPALPPLCLALGKMLNGVVFLAESRSRAWRFLAVVPKRAIAISLVAALAVVLVRWIMLDGGPGMLTVAGAAIAMCAAAFYVAGRLRVSLTARAWTLAAAGAVMVLALGFHDLVPELSRRRSVHAEATDIRQHTKFSGAPVVYFGRPSHSATMHVSPAELVTFEASELKALERFVARRRQVVIVMPPYVTDRVQNALGPTVALRPAGGRGRIFVASQRETPPIRMGALPKTMR